MSRQKTLEIYKVLRKYNSKAARDYINAADYRERINEAARKALLGIKDEPPKID